MLQLPEARGQFRLDGAQVPGVLFGALLQFFLGGEGDLLVLGAEALE